MKKYALALSLALAAAACSSSGSGNGGTPGSGGSGGGGGSDGGGVKPAAPLALNCSLFGNDARLPFEIDVLLAGEPQIGQPVDATVSVAMVLPVEVVCGIEEAGFTSTDILSGSDTLTITGVSAPDPGEVTVTLAGTPITDIGFAEGCDGGDGPGLVFAFEPRTISITPNGASTIDFLQTVDGVDVTLANLMGPLTIPRLNIPAQCDENPPSAELMIETPSVGADPDGDLLFDTLATPPFQIQIPVLCDGQSCDDENECTADACVEGACSSTNVEDDVPCDGGDGVCNDGSCVGLLCRGVDCSDENLCTVDPTCNPANGMCEGGSNEAEGTLCNRNGSQGLCDGAGNCVGCNADADCTEGETECKESLCDNDTSECLAAEDLPDDTGCTLVGGAAGQCISGECLGLCFDAETRCDTNQCLDTDCDPTNGTCLNTPLENQPCDLNGSNGICSATGVCEAAPNCDDAATRCIDNADNECIDDTCEPATGDCGSANVSNGTSCNSDAGTCQDGTCEGIPLTCGDPLNGVAEPCLSAFVLSDDCFLVTGSVPVPTTPIVTPTAPLIAGTSVDIFPQIQASLPWPLLCTLAGPAGGGADLKDSVLEMVRFGLVPDSATHSYVNPTSVFLPNVATPHGAVPLDFNNACQTLSDIDVNLFVNTGAGVCEGASVPDGGTCVGGDLAGNACTFTSDCAAAAALDLSNLAGSLGATQALGIVPAGATELFGFTHADISIDLGDVLSALPDVCIGGACPTYGQGRIQNIPSIGDVVLPATDGCTPTDRDGNGAPGDPEDSPRVMYDANCSTLDVINGTGCVPFITGNDAYEVLACDLGTDTTNPNWGQSCTEATSDADCGTGVACTLQTLGSLFTESGFPVLTDCCNSKGEGDGTAGEPFGCGPAGGIKPTADGGVRRRPSALPEGFGGAVGDHTRQLIEPKLKLRM